MTPDEVTVTGAEGLPEHVAAALRSIAAAAGDDEISVTSKARTVRRQVEVILDYYIECTADDRGTRARREAGRCGVEAAMRVYDEACRGPLALYDPGRSRAANTDAITAELTTTLAALGDERSCMVHVQLPGITLKNVAVDVAPSSVRDGARFYDAVTASPSVVRGRFYHPPIPGRPPSEVADSAFHLEFPR